MADEGTQVPMESQSNAGKWILIIVAILVVAGFGYAHYMTHTELQKLNADLSASQAQVKELQNRMQTSEAQEETLARQAGMTKKELASAHLAIAGRTEGRDSAAGRTAEGADHRGHGRYQRRENRRRRS